MPNKQGFLKIATFFFAIFLISLDRALKLIALRISGINFSLFGGFLSFNFVPNKFISFSIPLSGFWLNFVILGLIIALIFLFLKHKTDFPLNLFLFSVILGAFSNFLDRLKYGFVVDYLDLKYFTVFNLADFMISLGVLSLIVFVYKNPNKNIH